MRRHIANECVDHFLFFFIPAIFLNEISDGFYPFCHVGIEKYVRISSQSLLVIKTQCVESSRFSNLSYTLCRLTNLLRSYLDFQNPLSNVTFSNEMFFNFCIITVFSVSVSFYGFTYIKTVDILYFYRL